MYSSILLERHRTFSKLCALIFTRPMGGGPRTFPGGVNKWQWKRMHEKRAREKEKNLLEQEKQIYQARIRSQIRVQVAGKTDSNPTTDPSTGHGPMSPTDHIKALANRFMREGAEDLWNEDDGPLKSTPPRGPDRQSGFTGSNGRRGAIGSPIDLRRLVSEGRENANLTNLNRNSVNERNYSVQRRRRFRRNGSSESSDDDSDYRPVVSEPVRPFARNLAGNRNDTNSKNAKFCRDNESSGSDDSGFKGESKRYFAGNSSLKWPRLSVDGEEGLKDENEGVRGGRGVRKVVGSSASLGKYDVKITKRVPLRSLEEECDFSGDVELIRRELSKRRSLVENGREKGEESVLSKKRFDECGISPLTVKAFSAAGYVQMTRVQEATLSVCLEGKDALVKAKTGTGKTAAFLLPTIEAVLKATSENTVQRVPPIYALILCPMRELASQIAAEAKVMLKYHDGIGVQTLVGGTRFKEDQKQLESDPCQIIVATPGRLLDHIENRSGLSVRLMGLKMLVLDEADHLLDLGFRKDMEKIVDCLPRERQSLLFSATIPKEVRRISQLVLKREHAFIDTVGLGCVETPTQVLQFCLVASHELHSQIVYHLLKEHISQSPDYKVVVFCTTGMVTSLMYLLLREMKMNVREIHSRKPQLYRTRVSDEFRASKRLILVTSDVSTRGINYPDVTLVIQIGIPSDREQYIHRLGRTGREGKEGEGILLLAPWEEYFLDEIKDLPLEKVPLPHLDPEIKLKIEDSLAKVDGSVKEAAYHAWLGYYNSIKEIGRDKTTLVELANQFCQSIGLQKPPALFRKTALKMGLKGIPGIRTRN
ncbi:probable DEAD-box ATP-dependent RNA helicase 48 [Corylus avellana]|uniref:probable DEAD-box ATP-dependent RNA helicase 48 n=1 Tax=Corylus avellana TaxID=13451 RepID=UPI00286C85A6|nr:probable DEAD-box ATP-dependent RNA helicase 48 [Corylus avellana]